MASSPKVAEAESVDAARSRKLHLSPPNAQPKPKPSKAERRELQEKQRAAKQDAGVKPPKKQQSNLTKSKEQSIQDGRSGNPTQGSHPVAAFAKDSLSTTSDADILRDLRIFSHFGSSARLPSQSISSKADIHPAIIRLALQFSSFRIVGANARCIATLAAFKTVSYAVCRHHIFSPTYRSYSNTKLLLVQHCLDTF